MSVQKKESMSIKKENPSRMRRRIKRAEKHNFCMLRDFLVGCRNLPDLSYFIYKGQGQITSNKGDFTKKLDLLSVGIQYWSDVDTLSLNELFKDASERAALLRGIAIRKKKYKESQESKSSL